MSETLERGIAPFGVLQIHPEAYITEELVTRTVAHNAARTARRLYEQAHQLPYVRTDKDRPDIVNVAWWNGKRGSRRTIHDFPSHLERMRSFKLCAERLLVFAGIDQPEWISLLRDQAGLRDYHTDEYDGGRALLLLEGVKTVDLIHPFAPVTVVYTQLPGDAYNMEFQPNPMSLMHAVDNLCERNISMYVNTYNG